MGVQYISLTRTTNLAYLDAKEWTNMYFEPLISVKCCPKLHIKQLRNNLHYICHYITFVNISGWVGVGSQMKRGGSRKRGGQDPLNPPPPPLDTPMLYQLNLVRKCKKRSDLSSMTTNLTWFIVSGIRENLVQSVMEVFLNVFFMIIQSLTISSYSSWTSVVAIWTSK